ncbi:MAG: hypothetical protein QGG36_30635 [Pirellulaceae bacterium]|jgi:hypothetical protein|nr:hypothetical protein [Pirellulaceae bacterium]MDP7020194.1 hypothetical protein [Pirellulaceae bacterium]
MPASFERAGISFQFPDNWKLQDPDPASLSVSVESPQGAFWSLDLFPGYHEPTNLAEETLRTIKEEYDEVESQFVQTEVCGEPAVGFDMQFYCLDLLIQSKTRVVEVGGETLVLLFQAEDRDFTSLEQVFHAITASLFESLR